MSIKDMTEFDLDCMYNSLFANESFIDWTANAMRSHVSALQRRSAKLMTEHELGTREMLNYSSKRVLWACSTARLKAKVIAATAEKTNTSAIEGIMHDSDSDDSPPTSIVEIKAADANSWYLAFISDWIQKSVAEWDGSGFRESVARAFRRRSMRANETGRTTAFGGTLEVLRSRGATDTCEEILHSIYYVKLFNIPCN